MNKILKRRLKQQLILCQWASLHYNRLLMIQYRRLQNVQKDQFIDLINLTSNVINTLKAQWKVDVNLRSNSMDL